MQSFAGKMALIIETSSGIGEAVGHRAVCEYQSSLWAVSEAYACSMDRDDATDIFDFGSRMKEADHE